ncbi:MAG: helix-turn-helix domain-containing protein [Planctomycetales bacterium]
MAGKDVGLQLTADEIAAAFADPAWAKKFPPVLTLDEAAELLRVPKATLYDWRSRGMLTKCSRKVGKHVRVFRDRLITKVFNEGL